MKRLSIGIRAHIGIHPNLWVNTDGGVNHAVRLFAFDVDKQPSGQRPAGALDNSDRSVQVLMPAGGSAPIGFR
jgi:hypothetical protein